MNANWRTCVTNSALFYAIGAWAIACGSSTTNGVVGAGGLSGVGSGGGPGSTGVSTLPTPSRLDVPRPAGSPGNLKVLDWAGFKSALTYTLDDAQPSQVEHYDELAAAGVPMTFFITSGNAASSNTTFTKAVADGHEMGNHTVHHCHADLTGCSGGAATSLDAEIDGCSSYIVGHFGQPAVWTAASPFGDVGYADAYTSRFFLNRGVSGGMIAPDDRTDPFNLPCHAAVEGETAASFNHAIDGANSAGSWLIFLIHTLGPTANSWYAPIDISVVTDSVSHARELGDVWVDSMVNVGAYWRAQNVLSKTTPTTSNGAQTWAWTLPEHFPPGKYLRVVVDGGTLSQAGEAVPWDSHGYYEIALDVGSVTVSP